MIDTLDKLIKELTDIRDSAPDRGSEPISVFDSNTGEPLTIKYVDSYPKEIGNDIVKRIDIIIEQ